MTIKRHVTVAFYSIIEAIILWHQLISDILDAQKLGTNLEFQLYAHTKLEY